MAVTLDSCRVDLMDSSTLLSAWHRRLTMADFFLPFSVATSPNNFAGSLHFGFINKMYNVYIIYR